MSVENYKAQFYEPWNYKRIAFKFNEKISINLHFKTLSPLARYSLDILQIQYNTTESTEIEYEWNIKIVVTNSNHDDEAAMVATWMERKVIVISPHWTHI